MHNRDAQELEHTDREIQRLEAKRIRYISMLGLIAEHEACVHLEPKEEEPLCLKHFKNIEAEARAGLEYVNIGLKSLKDYREEVTRIIAES